MAGKNQRLELTWYNKDKALIPTENGKYGYTWVDPRDPRYCETHTLVTTDSVVGTQAPKEEGITYSERADNEPQDDNLLILGESGDVLEALTRVPELRDKYLGKVKCVYIDPPFNTAQTFANYEDNLEHSVWLTMMRDRLLHLRELLSDDGSIWVHLDDVENHRMRLLMDEVFGTGNFVSEVVWEKTYSPRNDSKSIPAVTDMILVYRKADPFSPNRLPRTAEMDGRYKNPDSDPRGPWSSADLTANHGDGAGGMCYAIQSPITGELVRPSGGRSWAWGQEKILGILNEWAPYRLEQLDDHVWRAENENIPLEKVKRDVKAIVLDIPQSEAEVLIQKRLAAGNWPEIIITKAGWFRRKSWLAEMSGKTPTNLLTHLTVGHTDTAAKETRALFPGQSPFATPKPERLLERIIHIATNPGDIVLDVFAGSGTTAAVAQKMGRRWVTCELVEDTFNRFTRPRLEKVVNGEDMGGISTTKGERVDDTENGLPEGMTAEDAQKFTAMLNKIIKNHDDLKKSADVKAIKALSKTVKTKDTVNWRGGGGFTVARLAPSCYDYDPEMGYTSLTPAATGETLIASVAANLGFYLTPEDPRFDGRRNNQHLAVVEGVLTEQKVGDLMTFLPEGHSILFAATMLDEGIRDVIRSFKNGSRTVHIPLDLFPYSAEEEN
ncbi:site-specific DNA-methyltransferase [Corynebacterium striatum]|uniref:Site-specific DNA-methyltransferase n=1 Tax=Corynebacterium striatum TaxID=43770 RepID=A0A2Z2IX25_CORST|nr:site-specific DNA-methyltransferase [Corynebacterium striatum]ART20890.1 site-specific DNA-methyltransferase [Corynebacterium striatum]